MIAIESIVKIAEIVFEKLKDWTKSRHEKIGRVYETVVVDSFRDLEVIHKDYVTKLSEIRERLLSRSMGPTALISWIRNAGLEYRPEREALWTIGLELNALSRSVTKFKRNLRSKTKADKFSDAIANYVYSIPCYSRVSKDKAWPGFSLFRSYEDEFDAVCLQVRLECRKLEGPEYSSELLKSRFYEHELVLASEHNIKSLCDEYLPAAWQEVCRAHRAVRAAAGYPDSANKKST